MIDNAQGRKYTTTAILELLQEKLGFDRGAPQPRPDLPEQDPLT
jgi:hypothetical protein